jgi:chemotaxis protein methyltransferase CheR
MIARKLHRPHVPYGDPDFVRLKALVIERTGHAYFQDKDSALWERVSRRMETLGDRSCAAYLARLEGADGESEWRLLEAEITIGETFFFRYPEQFSALRQVILPDVVERKREAKRIRIWSAGCATGAEAYSVAIVVREVLGAEFDDWSVAIIGTDINDAFLEIARSGSFNAWALRSLDAQERAAYFLPPNARGQYVLKPDYRGRVIFQRHNLLDLLNEAQSPLQMDAFDIILCRNVLIYFETEEAGNILKALSNRLTPGGWLLVGAAEPVPVADDLAQRPLEGTSAYQRCTTPGEAGNGRSGRRTDSQVYVPPELPPLPKRKGEAAAATRAPEDVRASRRKSVSAAPPEDAAPAETTTVAETIRNLCGIGELDRAQEICARWLAEEPMNAAGHYFDALIADAQHDEKRAEASLKRALYIDRNFVMGHYHLGLLLMRRGQSAAGRRHIVNAMTLARALPGDRLLPEGAGLTAEWLLANAQHYLDLVDQNKRTVA